MFPKMVNLPRKALNQQKKSTDYFDFENVKELEMVNIMVGYHMKNMVHIHVPSARVCLILHVHMSPHYKSETNKDRDESREVSCKEQKQIPQTERWNSWSMKIKLNDKVNSGGVSE